MAFLAGHRNRILTEVMQCENYVIMALNYGWQFLWHVELQSPSAWWSDEHWSRVIRYLIFELQLLLHSFCKASRKLLLSTAVRYSWRSVKKLGTRRTWVVSFTPRPLYSRGRCPRYPLKRLGEHQRNYGSFGRRKFLVLAGNRTTIWYCKARTLAIVLAKSFVSVSLQTLILSSSWNNSSLLISAFKFASMYFLFGQSNLIMKKIMTLFYVMMTLINYTVG